MKLLFAGVDLLNWRLVMKRGDCDLFAQKLDRDCSDSGRNEFLMVLWENWGSWRSCGDGRAVDGGVLF